MRIIQSNLEGGTKNAQEAREEGRNLGKGRTGSEVFWGAGEDRKENQRANRMNGNMQPRWVAGRVTLQKIPETWEVRDSQDSMGITLN